MISLFLGNTENVNRNRLGVSTVPSLNAMLTASQTLQFLDLRSTNLTDSGLQLLCEGLVCCPSLFHLNLAKNDLTQTGIEHFAPIIGRTALIELDLSLNPLGNGGVRCLGENLWYKSESPKEKNPS